MSDAQDEYGNFRNGHSSADAQRAGVTAHDSVGLAECKIEDLKSKELADRLKDVGSRPVSSSSEQKGRWPVNFLGMFSLAVIGYYAWRVLVYVLENYAWANVKEIGVLPDGFWWQTAIALVVVGAPAFMLWRLSIKFFTWLCC